MLRVVLSLIVATFAIRVHCQTLTLLDATSSYLTYDEIEIDPGSTIILRFKTAQLNATVLYMQGSNDTFVYVHLVNGRIALTANDDVETTTEQSPEPHNTNKFVRVEVMIEDGMIVLMSDGGESVVVDTNGQFASPIFVGGIPDPPPFSIISGEAMNNNHFVGCFRALKFDDGSTTADLVATNRSSDVMDDCIGRCSSLDCNPGAGNGECIEYYTRGECDCRSVPVSEGAECNDLATPVNMDGNSYRCYTLPQYDSPFVETETIIAYVTDAPATGILMTGQQGDYRFSLYFAQQKLHYEASINDSTIVSISTTASIMTGTVEVRRTVGSVTIIAPDSGVSAMENFTSEAFRFVRFTEICVGGGLLDNRVYFGFLQSVYYNHYYLSGDGDDYNERNVSRVKRVNFDDNNAQIGLPGSLEDYTNIELSFRTSQDNAILLHCERGNDHFRISINNSRLYASLVVGDQIRTSSCNILNITNTNWYKLVIEPLLGSDAGNRVLLRLSTLSDTPDSPGDSDRCDLLTSFINNFRSTPVMIGGMAGGVDSLMGCLESMLNMQQVNFDVVLGNTIHTGDCEPCNISPCRNGGRCNNIDDYSFNCSCVDPYFGDFCEMMRPMMSTMISTTMATTTMVTTTMMTTTTATTTTIVIATTSSIEPTNLVTSSILSSPSTSSDIVTSTMASPSTTSTPSTPDVPSEAGGDDSNVGAIIGIVLGIIVGVLLLILVILIIIVVIRNRNNRQGFYPTNEGKGGDEMILKYSASLRSITRPTTASANAENGGTINRVTKKEQEYYI